MTAPRIVIVGAGPAGIRAAETLADNGLRPILIDEAPRCGGQIYRQPPADAGFVRTPDQFYGFEAANARALHADFERLAGRIDYRPQTLVWDVVDRTAFTERAGAIERVPFDALILATGAMDRVIPFPGWTLPGVFSLGGAQIALKYQGCAIGRRPVFMGTGPLLYLVAWQYAKAGVRVAAVLDTSPLRRCIRAAPQLAGNWRLLFQGIRMHAALRRAGIAIETGIRPRAAVGQEAVEAIRYCRETSPDTSIEIFCDSIAFGFGLKPETQLAELAGCRFCWDDAARQWLPDRDAAGRAAGTEHVYLAGDGAGIGGAEVAELQGGRAAWALLEDLRRPLDRQRVARLESDLKSHARFRSGLEAAFPFPAELARTIGDDTVVCRCEAATAGELRSSARELDATELNRAKVYSRIGMGRCQGRVCGPAAAEILAAALDVPVDRVGRLRGQAPVKPVPVAALASA